MTLADRLRTAIAATHTAIEDTPLAKAMIRGTITRDAYADWLVQMGHIHQALEAAAAGCADVAAVYAPAEMDRAGVIARDRAAFPEATDPFPWEAVAWLCGRFAEWRADAPWKLLGALYVIEGSRMGSMALARPLAKAFGIAPQPGAGLDYHLDGIATRPAKWQQFRATLSALALTEPQRDEVAAAAVEVMQGLCDLYASERFSTPGSGKTRIWRLTEPVS